MSCHFIFQSGDRIKNAALMHVIMKSPMDTHVTWRQLMFESTSGQGGVLQVDSQMHVDNMVPSDACW